MVNLPKAMADSYLSSFLVLISVVLLDRPKRKYGKQIKKKQPTNIINFGRFAISFFLLLIIGPPLIANHRLAYRSGPTCHPRCVHFLSEMKLSQVSNKRSVLARESQKVFGNCL